MPSNLNGSNKRCDTFRVASSHPAPFLEVQKCILDEVSDLVNMFIVVAQNFAVLLRRNYRCHSRLKCASYNGVSDISPRSTSKYSALKSEINDFASAQSETVASVTKNCVGIS